MNKRPEQLSGIYIDPSFTEIEKLKKLAENNGIPCHVDGNSIARLSDKENIYAAGEFKKYSCVIKKSNNHIVLVSPSDMGNIGTIIRTAVGIGDFDLILIEPCADIFNPKTIRASMGALFSIDFSVYSKFNDYLEIYGDRQFYPFMLDGSIPLSEIEKPRDPYTLIFGNEAAGLPAEFNKIGQSVRIDQNNNIDSYNLAVSAAIALYTFKYALK